MKQNSLAFTSLTLLLCGFASLHGCAKPDMLPEDGILVGVRIGVGRKPAVQSFPKGSVIAERVMAAVDADTEFAQEVFVDPQGEAMAVRVGRVPAAAATGGVAAGPNLVVAWCDGQTVRAGRFRPVGSGGVVALGPGSRVLTAASGSAFGSSCTIDPATATYFITANPARELTGVVRFDQSSSAWVYTSADRPTPRRLEVDGVSMERLRGHQLEQFDMGPSPGRRSTWCVGVVAPDLKVLVSPDRTRLQLISERGMIQDMTDGALRIVRVAKTERVSGSRDVAFVDCVVYTMSDSGSWRLCPVFDARTLGSIGDFSLKGRWMRVPPVTSVRQQGGYGFFVFGWSREVDYFDVVPVCPAPGKAELRYNTGVETEAETFWLRR